jgi:hypothetical protein
MVYIPSLFSDFRQWLTRLHNIRHAITAIPLDPFLIVPPSLNDSLLVKQGLVEETTLPQPTHSAYDIQVCFAVQLVPMFLEWSSHRDHSLGLGGTAMHSSRHRGRVWEAVLMLRHFRQTHMGAYRGMRRPSFLG